MKTTNVIAQALLLVLAAVFTTGCATMKVTSLPILTPKVAYINRTVGATSFGKSITSIKVEWTLAEPSGQTIWADTYGVLTKYTSGRSSFPPCMQPMPESPL